MINQKISIEESRVHELAEKRFIRTCGFDLEKEKHQRMMKLGQKVREDGIGGIKINGLISFYDASAFCDNLVQAEGETLFCNYFEQLPEGCVEGVYFYMLTAGECYFSSEENIMDFLYADIWGTSYVDAGISVLTEEYIKPDIGQRFPDRALFLSEEFGPGYFGMPVSESKKFFNILDGSLIGVRVKESGLMIPQKTCTGFYLLLNRNDLKAEAECLKCHGNKNGCSFCAVRAKLDEEGSAK